MTTVATGFPFLLSEPEPSGVLTRDGGAPALAGGVWFAVGQGEPYGSALAHAVAPGRLVGARFVCVDLLLESDHFMTFALALETGGGANVASFGFSPVTRCQTRVWFALAGLDLSAVERVSVRILRYPGLPARVCLAPLVVSVAEPQRLETPLLPQGPIVDELGQSRLHPRAGRMRGHDELVSHLRRLHDEAPAQQLPAGQGRWGGWSERKVEATGFFRTHHDGRRWWLVDPDGCLFWSSGVDCVHPSIDHETHYETRQMNLRPALAWMPDLAGPFAPAYHTNPYHSPDNREFNFVESNFIRAFGPQRWHEAWTTVAASEVRKLGFNTAGDWSDEPAMSRARVPYARPLDLHFRFPNVQRITGSFPDVFDPRFEAGAAKLAEPLRATADDPAMLGYFMTNEPSVGWEIDETRGLAAAMLVKTPACASRRALADWLRARYGGGDGLAKAWDMPVRLEAVAQGPWHVTLTEAAHADLTAFSTVLLERLLKVTGDACRRADPNHLNLGIRLWTFPRGWMLRAMKCLDVVSFNCYMHKPVMLSYGHRDIEPGIAAEVANLGRPMLIGEWHFGALDGGLPSAGLCRVRDQEERGKAFRVYQEHAAAQPWLVGAHWFNLYDRQALSGAASNENYNIGFLDMVHLPHDPICRAARATHERLYAVASGATPPIDMPVDHCYPSR